MTMSKDAEKAFNKTNFDLETTSLNGCRRNIFNLIKGNHQNPRINITQNDET